MFNGGDQIKVKTSLSFDEVCDRVEEVLDELGPVRLTKSGRFTIEPGRQSGFFTEVSYRGDIRERKGGEGYVINLDYSVAPSVVCWVFGILGFMLCIIGCLVFLFPLLAKNDVENSVRRTLDEIEDELGR